MNHPPVTVTKETNDLSTNGQGKKSASFDQLSEIFGSQVAPVRSFCPSWDYELKHQIPLLTLSGENILQASNIMGIVGKPGAGKSSVIEALCALAENPTADAFGLALNLPSGKNVVYIDTERDSDLHFIAWSRMMAKAGLPRPRMPEKVFWYAFRKIPSVMARKDELRRILDEVNCGLLIVDGIRHFVRSINDEGEVTDVLGWFMALMEGGDFGTVMTIHDNPKDTTGKSRGWLGTEIYNNCRSNFQIVFDRKSDIRKMTTDFDFGKVSTGKPVLETNFRFDAGLGMMVSCESAQNGGMPKSVFDPAAKYRTEIDKMILSDTRTYNYSELQTRFTEKVGLGKSTFDGRLKAYLDAGLLRKQNDNNYSTADFQPF